MSDAAEGDAADQQPIKRTPRRRTWLLLALFAVTAAAGAYYSYYSYYSGRARAPQLTPPEITLDELSTKDAGDIQAAFQEAMQEPNSAAAWGRLGMYFAAYSSHHKSQQCFEYAHALDPDEFRWVYLLGVSLSASDPPAAVKPLQEAIALRKAFPVAHLRLGELLLEMDQLEEAEKHLEMALQGEPLDVRTLTAIAQVRMARGDLDAALENAQKALKHGGSFRTPHETLASVLHQRGDHEGAQRELTIADRLPAAFVPYQDTFVVEVQSLRSHADPLVQANQLAAQGRMQEAIELLGNAWNDGATDPNVPCELAVLLARSKQPQMAAAVLDRAAQQHPNSAHVRVQRGVLFYLLSDYQNASRAFGEAIDRKPDDAVAHLYLGLSHDKLGNKAAAVEALRAAVRLQPDNADAHGNLGRVLLEQGDSPAAKASLQTAIQLAPENANIQRLLRLASSKPRPPAETNPQP